MFVDDRIFACFAKLTLLMRFLKERQRYGLVMWVRRVENLMSRRSACLRALVTPVAVDDNRVAVPDDCIGLGGG